MGVAYAHPPPPEIHILFLKIEFTTAPYELGLKQAFFFFFFIWCTNFKCSKDMLPLWKIIQNYTNDILLSPATSPQKEKPVL